MKLTTVFFYLLALLTGTFFFLADPLTKEPSHPVRTYSTCPETETAVLSVMPLVNCVPEPTGSTALHPEALLQPDEIATGADSTFIAPEFELYPDQWHLENLGKIPGVPNGMLLPGADARVRAAWRQMGNRGSSNVRIGIYDNGFDPDHPYLASRVVATYDAIHDREELFPSSSSGHGTSVAGVVSSAAPNAELVLIQGLSFREDVQRRALAYALRMEIDILICSWGTVEPVHEPSEEITSLYTEAMRNGRGGKGMVIIFAAGNEGLPYINYYAQIPGVVAVGASNSWDGHNAYSNRGQELLLVAPSDGGWPILTLRAHFAKGSIGSPMSKRFYVDGLDRGPEYQHFGGTSSSAPLVGAIAGLALGTNPDLTTQEVTLLLSASSRKIGPEWSYDHSGFSTRFGYGCVNAEAAVALAFAWRSPVSEVVRNVPGIPSAKEHKYQPVTPIGPVLVASNEALSEQIRPDALEVHSGFGVQVTAYAEFSNVHPEVARLKLTYGLQVIVKAVKVDGRVVYRILIGPVQTLEEAYALSDQLRKGGEKSLWVQQLSGK